ncbi:MAG: AAC(3) family N-acetyltransferase [Spirochaetia bacterium]|nr:AAC(3) family N-acetyltransferase [Spirochaetia bacterium]
MHTKQSLMRDLTNLGLDKTGTTLAHFSYKSIGEVEGGPQTVIDSFLAYMQEGLMLIPTHTWDNVNAKQPYYSVNDTPPCIGAIPTLALKTEGAIRSAHPTHSVAAFGREAASFVADDHLHTTPCPRTGVWGKLYDNDATILLVGVGLNRDTFIHGVEEWADIPERVSEEKHMLFVRLADGTLVPTPMSGHLNQVAKNFPRVEPYLREKGILKEGKLGDATVLYHKARALADAVTELLKEDPDLFGNHDATSQA